MTYLSFDKYQGTGNDFVIINALQHPEALRLSVEQRRMICDRNFGIGADGLMLYGLSNDNDFEMHYYNADGNDSSMCGNGGRCLVEYGYRHGLHKEEVRFDAVDGLHEASVRGPAYIELKMGDVDEVKAEEGFYLLDTGSPHYIEFMDTLEGFDIVAHGRSIRYSDRFKKEGINVNAVVKHSDRLEMQTYERGVEDETLSCGTGVTAAAIASVMDTDILGSHTVDVQTKGGNLQVRFERSSATTFRNIWLCGPATFVYSGEIALEL